MRVTAARCAIAQAPADRGLDSQEDFAGLQVARLNKALLRADTALAEGDAKAIPNFVKVVAEIDRYYGLLRPALSDRPAHPGSRPPPPGGAQGRT